MPSAFSHSSNNTVAIPRRRYPGRTPRVVIHPSPLCFFTAPPTNPTIFPSTIAFSLTSPGSESAAINSNSGQASCGKQTCSMVRIPPRSFNPAVSITNEGGVCSGICCKDGLGFHPTHLVFQPQFLETLLLGLADEVTDHTGELHREDVLGGRAGSHALEGLKVLQGHGLLVNVVGSS